MQTLEHRLNLAPPRNVLPWVLLQDARHGVQVSADHRELPLTHHFRWLDEKTGTLVGAISDHQVQRVRELVTAAGQPFVYKSLPEMGHGMHFQDPALYAAILTEWVATLPTEAEVRKRGVFANPAA